ncbi:MAG: foldase [Flammeovirgaceae bacterium]|nr:foldase [Flammeovirgaceae bacterium]
MAIIGTLRNKMTKVVVGFVAVAIIAFVLNDLFGSGPTALFGGTDTTVGEISGDEISLEEFQGAIQDRENNYILNFGRRPSEREMISIRQQAWDMLISNHAIKPEYEKVGVVVPEDEIWDMVQGKNVDENIKSSFLDSAGRFDRSQLITYLQYVDGLAITDESRIRWDIFRRNLGPGRERLKYENLLIKTNYVTAAEAEQDYHRQNDVAEIQYLYIPYYVISDTLINLTDSDFQAYYNKNKQKYKVDETRNLKYVTFPVSASADDSLAIREELTRMISDFTSTKEDSVFATINTDASEAFARYNISDLPVFFSDNPDNMEAGKVIGPYLEEGAYRLSKLVAKETDTTYYARASHILIRWESDTDESKKEAKSKARKILSEIKAGADFGAQAREHGTDGTASNGGDLGWFANNGSMVKPFEDAVFKATKTGVLNDVVETEFGYHLIDITRVKDNSTYVVATIDRNILPSDDTQNEAYRKADNFANSVSGIDEFTDLASAEGLSVFDANDLSGIDRRIGSLSDARQVITWLFRDGSKNKVSTVFDLETDYVVAVVTGITEKGFKSLSSVKEEITPMVKNDLKGTMIIEKLTNKEGSLEELKGLFGNDATVGTSSDLKMNVNSIPTVGFDPVAVGKAFSLADNTRSKPFKGENGVLIIDTKTKQLHRRLEIIRCLRINYFRPLTTEVV